MFGNRLCFLRHRAGLTQAQLAQALHLSTGALGMYEQGRRTPSVRILVAISQFFGVSTEFLLTGCGVNEREIRYEMMISLFSSISDDPEVIHRYIKKWQ